MYCCSYSRKTCNKQRNLKFELNKYILNCLSCCDGETVYGPGPKGAQIPSPDDTEWVQSRDRIIFTAENRGSWRGTCPRATLSTTWTTLEMNWSLCDKGMIFPYKRNDLVIWGKNVFSCCPRWTVYDVCPLLLRSGAMRAALCPGISSVMKDASYRLVAASRKETWSQTERTKWEWI